MGKSHPVFRPAAPERPHPREPRAQPRERLPAAPALRSRSARVAGPLTRACTVPMVPSPASASPRCRDTVKDRLVRTEVGSAVAELPVRAPPTSPRTQRTGGGHDAPPSPRPLAHSASAHWPLRAGDPDVHRTPPPSPGSPAAWRRRGRRAFEVSPEWAGL